MSPSQTSAATGIGSLDDLYAYLSEHSYEPLWTMKGGLTPEPVTAMRPHLWPYREARDLVVRAGDLISVEEADRRVLAYRNPGTADHEIARATDTLWAAIQMVLPGEEAPPHRHTAAALRFIIEGAGGYTIVDGSRVTMEPGDFLITPNWSWHAHGHTGDGPMIWLDGLDAPMVSTLRQMFAEFEGAGTEEMPVYSETLRSGQLAPSWMADEAFGTVSWKLADAEAALAELREGKGSPYDDVILEYRNPLAGGSALKTVAAYIQLLRPGVETSSHRQTSSAVYHAVRGSGVSVIGGERFEWTRGDTFAVPTWAEHSHANPGTEDALLFSYTDEPAIRALGLYREQG